MCEYTWNESTPSHDWSEFSNEGAITEQDFAKLEFDTVYPAQITAIREIRSLPRKEGKPPTKVISYTINVFARTPAGKEVAMERRLRDVWIMAGYNGSPPDYSSLLGVARASMDDDFIVDEDSRPLLDEEHNVEWWMNSVVGHSMYVKTRRGRAYEKDGEEKIPMTFYVDSPWPDGPRPLEDLGF